MPSGLVTLYLYSNAGPTNHATASATTLAPSDLVTPLTQTKYEYDAFGRIDSLLQLMPDPQSTLGFFNHRDTVWNSLGQKLSETEPAAVGTVGAQSTYKYDAFGRITSVTPPDGPAHAVSYSYAGVRATTTTIGAGAGGIGSDLVAGNVVEHPVSRTVEHDTFGRLTKVTESVRGLNSPTTTTSYGYDVLDHLATVTMAAPEGVQVRTFAFDNRGFLVREAHPEAGTTTYDKYDVYGHALHKLQGASDGPFDLKFVYDVYQRLTEVRQGANGQTLVKQMTYDTLPVGNPGAPYSENGQLVKSYRRNFHPELGGDVAVNSYFHYDPTGRLDQKITAVGTGPSFTQHYSYDVLGDVTSVQYPTCSTCTPIAAGAAIPARTIDFRWSHGYLAGVDQGSTHFTSTATPIAYWPNGMIKSITHVAADGSLPVTDSQTLDQGMARPSTITFDGATEQACPPSAAITVNPGVIQGGAAATASVPALTGATYSWSATNATITPPSTGPSITFTAFCSGPVTLSLAVTSCGTTVNGTFTVPVTPPALTVSATPLSPAGSATLTVTYGGITPWSIT